MSEYIKLTIAALLPVVLCILFYILIKRDKKLARLPYWARQIIIGVSFGALACLGTHWGIEIDGAMVNARDAAVLIAGLMFGPPAGIIAGIIGGVERLLAGYIWGIGTFTVIACSVSTALSGVYAAWLRRFMFENKKPGWLMSFAMGVFIEVFHLTMIFVTHMNETEQAMRVVRACTTPMLIANGVAVMLASMALSFLEHKKGEKVKLFKSETISQAIQRQLLIVVTIAFMLTLTFVALFQSNAANTQADSYLKTAIQEVRSDINSTSNTNVLRIAEQAAADYESGMSIHDIVQRYALTEASYINSKGIITDSSNKKFLRYDMAGAVQSKEFLVILGGKHSYVQPLQRIGYDRKTLRKYAAVKSKNGFFQIGYDVEKFQGIIDESVEGITQNRHVGESGYIVILNSHYQAISKPSGFNMDLLREQREALKNAKDGETFRMKLGEEKVLARETKTEGFYIISIFPEKEAYGPLAMALYLNAFAQVFMFALLFTSVYFMLKHSVVNKIDEVNNSLTKITDGDLEETVDVRSSVEFVSLSDDINATVTALKGYIDEAEKRIEAELEFAHLIQHSALPLLAPMQKEFDIFASMDTAKEVGGDFYDFYYDKGNNKLYILIADVSGKGIPAAMFMMRAKSILRSLIESGLPLAETINSANDTLCAGNNADMFVTVWAGLIDLESGIMRYVNAGHNPPAVRHRGGKFELLRDKAGLVLAGMEGIRYKERTFTFEQGDQILLYTDGVTESTNSRNELFGEPRLLKALSAAPDTSAQGLCKAVKDAVDTFSAGAAQFDDITMLAYTYRKPEEKSE